MEQYRAMKRVFDSNNGPVRYAIDRHGYRPNVGIILCNDSRQVLWARRANRDGWQFPQGGVERNETVVQAAYRELHEEIGLEATHVRMVGRTRRWLRYDVPHRTLRRTAHGRRFRGQKQVWFLFQLLGDDSYVCLDNCQRPEFDQWRWIDYWEPLDRIVEFKREVYANALQELEPMLSFTAAASGMAHS